MEFKTRHTSIKGLNKELSQDAFGIYEDDNLFIAVIADGLGSCMSSRIGARLICDAIISTLKNKSNYSESIVSDFEHNWLISLSNNGILPIEACTTFSALWVSKKARVCYVAKVGDSSLAIRMQNEVELFESEKDFLNETDCFGGKNWKYRFQAFTIKDSFDFIIASDGIGDEIDWTYTNNLFDFMKEKFYNKNNRSFSCSINNAFGKSNNDDKTIIIGWL